MAALSAMVAGLASCAGGGASNEPAGQAAVELLRGQPWDSVLARARGTEVVWRMWRGDPSVNAYVDGWIEPRLRGRYGVTLRAVEGQGPELVNQLVVEREA